MEAEVGSRESGEAEGFCGDWVAIGDVQQRDRQADADWADHDRRIYRCPPGCAFFIHSAPPTSCSELPSPLPTSTFRAPPLTRPAKLNRHPNIYKIHRRLQ